MSATGALMARTIILIALIVLIIVVLHLIGIAMSVTGGLFKILLIAGVLLYLLWPRNRQRTSDRE
jgi:hypothetical protein